VIDPSVLIVVLLNKISGSMKAFTILINIRGFVSLVEVPRDLDLSIGKA